MLWEGKCGGGRLWVSARNGEVVFFCLGWWRARERDVEDRVV